jgi:membrane-associated protease RseP (regulator of RpoE activity)
MDLTWWILIGLLIIFPAYLLRKRKNIETQAIFIMWRTQKGKALVEKLAKYPFFTYLADIGLVFAFGFIGALYLFLSQEHKRPFKKVLIDYVLFIISAIILIEPTFIFEQTITNPIWMITLLLTGFGGLSLYVVGWATWNVITDLIAGNTPTPLLQPVIPGLEIPGVPIQIPVSAWISLFIVIVVHELSHGIVAVREKLRLKSLGLITAGFFPIGAFAEPDEKQLQDTTMQKRTRVYSAGSMMNFAVTFVFLALLIPSQMLINPMLNANYYAEIVSVGDGSPAQLAGLTNDTKLYNIEVLSSNITSGTPVTLVTDKGNFTAVPNATGQLGLTFNQNLQLKSNSITHWIMYYYLEIVSWTAVLNFSVGMFNYLPFFIFDGARIFEDLFNFYAKRLGIKDKKLGSKVMMGLSVFIGLMLLLNIGILFIQ